MIRFVLREAILLLPDLKKRPIYYKQNFGQGTIHMGCQCQKQVQSLTRNYLTIFSLQMRSESLLILFSFDQSFIAPTIVIVMAMAHVTFITENVTVIKIGTLNWIAQVYCKFLDDEPSSLDPVYLSFFSLLLMFPILFCHVFQLLLSTHRRNNSSL